MSTPDVMLKQLIFFCTENALEPSTISTEDAKTRLLILESSKVTEGVVDINKVRKATDDAFCFNFKFCKAIQEVCDEEKMVMLQERFDMEYELVVLKWRAIDAWALANFSSSHETRLSLCCDIATVEAFILHQHAIVNSYKSRAGDGF